MGTKINKSELRDKTQARGELERHQRIIQKQNEVCECGHGKRFHTQEIAKCFYTKSKNNIVNINDVNCPCNKFIAQEQKEEKLLDNEK